MKDDFDDFDREDEDGGFVETDLEEDDEFYYEDTEAELYRIIPENAENDFAAMKRREQDEVLAFINGEELSEEIPADGGHEGEVLDASEVFSAEREAAENVVDFSDAANVKREKNKGSFKHFLKSHIRDIIAYGIAVLMIGGAMAAALVLRRQQEAVEAKLAAGGGNELIATFPVATDADGVASGGNARASEPDANINRP